MPSILSVERCDRTPAVAPTATGAPSHPRRSHEGVIELIRRPMAQISIYACVCMCACKGSQAARQSTRSTRDSARGQGKWDVRKKKMCGFFTLVMLCKVKKLYHGAANEPEEMDFPHVKMHFKDFSFVCFVLIDKRYDFPFSFAYWLLV